MSIINWCDPVHYRRFNLDTLFDEFEVDTFDLDGEITRRIHGGGEVTTHSKLRVIIKIEGHTFRLNPYRTLDEMRSKIKHHLSMVEFARAQVARMDGEL